MIDIRTPLTFRSAFYFPVQSKLARKETLIGGLLLMIPLVGWLLNMGHRIAIVNKMQHGLTPWPSWNMWGELLRHGGITALGMIYYFIPAILFLALAYFQNITWALSMSGLFAVLAVLAIPGYMTHYCKNYDISEIFNPFKALRRSFEGGSQYWLAWSIALTALAISVTGILLLGIGFLFTSVWFW